MREFRLENQIILLNVQFIEIMLHLKDSIIDERIIREMQTGLHLACFMFEFKTEIFTMCKHYHSTV